MCPRDIEIYLSAVFLYLAAALPHHNSNHEALKTKKIQLITIFALLAKVIKRDNSYSNAITNRVPIPVSYKTAVNNPIFDF